MSVLMKQKSRMVSGSYQRGSSIERMSLYMLCKFSVLTDTGECNTLRFLKSSLENHFSVQTPFIRPLLNQPGYCSHSPSKWRSLSLKCSDPHIVLGHSQLGHSGLAAFPLTDKKWGFWRNDTEKQHSSEWSINTQAGAEKKGLWVIGLWRGHHECLR